MKAFSLALTAAAVALSAVAANAADLRRAPPPVYVPPPPPPAYVAPVNWSGLYLSLDAGALWIPSVDTSFNDGAVTGHTDTKTGYRVGGAIGYDFSSAFGVEAEVNYGRVDLDTFTEDGVGTIDVAGSASVLTIMGNVIIGQQFGMIRPYVGIGVGGADVRLDVPAGQFGPDNAVDDDWTWAAQALVGVDLMVTNNVSIGARYRFQYVGDTNFVDGGGTPIALDGFGTHAVEGVLKVRFNG